MRLESKIGQATTTAFQHLYNIQLPGDQVQVQKTRADFEGDYTVVVFPLLRYSRKSPEVTGQELGEYLLGQMDEIDGFNVIKGFLNLTVTHAFWLDYLNGYQQEQEKFLADNEEVRVFVIEYSSPNTNKPLHLGHIRNNLLGYSVANILKANGHTVHKVNLVNDRGIHICKSMLAWQKWGQGETPGSAGMKGDHLVGKYYVLFDQEYKKEIEQLVQQGKEMEVAKKEAPLLLEAQEMLRKWEQGDPAVYQLWETMNQWVTDGFDVTYKNLGVDFDHIDYESETYKLGREEVLKGLQSEVFYKEENHSVWADLTEDGLDKKLLLRSDGTSVYMTQDIGTAIMRQQRYGFDDMVYVVGNEQDYHFQVLALVLQKLGYGWAKSIFHLSYGMVELPFGKMKSREGTVVDADDLMDGMIETARGMAAELGKLDGFTDKEKEDIYRMIGLGALKYFILKVDSRKNMTFNPEESIDFNGNTGPFVQYTYARIQSVFRKAREQGIDVPGGVDTGLLLSAKERELVKWIYLYPETVKQAGKNLSPAEVAGYVFELAKMYNQFYHDHSILKEPDEKKRDFRLQVSGASCEIIKDAMGLLGIEVPPGM